MPRNPERDVLLGIRKEPGLQGEERVLAQQRPMATCLESAGDGIGMLTLAEGRGSKVPTISPPAFLLVCSLAIQIISLKCRWHQPAVLGLPVRGQGWEKGRTGRLPGAST